MPIEGITAELANNNNNNNQNSLIFQQRINFTNMNNRLDEIPAWALEDSDDEGAVPASNGAGGDIEMQNQKSSYMDSFFKEVDGIKADIDAVAAASKEIARINEQSMRATTTSEENKLSKELKPLLDSTNKRARNTKQLLGLLKEETTNLKKEKKLNASDIR